MTATAHKELGDIIYENLMEAFAHSPYMHAPGAGDVQAVELVVDEAIENNLVEELLDVLTGAIQARALCYYGVAQTFASRIAEGANLI